MHIIQQKPEETKSIKNAYRTVKTRRDVYNNKKKKKKPTIKGSELQIQIMTSYYLNSSQLKLASDDLLRGKLLIRAQLAKAFKLSNPKKQLYQGNMMN